MIFIFLKKNRKGKVLKAKSFKHLDSWVKLSHAAREAPHILSVLAAAGCTASTGQKSWEVCVRQGDRLNRLQTGLLVGDRN